ncbi:hypothetical protein HGM15179_014416 [Zosterops borbonicus]|uniref:Uncharacterized protein n=1 Tax=Zosterops borbonicus TaxID=364589 RepID=A0A8K1G6H3_9PASS|nr:hypothetical protein HGM15179_014416 [Zosterops borbonicus]
MGDPRVCCAANACSEVRAQEPEGPGQSEQRNKSWPGWFALVVHRHFSKALAFSFHWWGGAFLLLRGFVAEKRMKKITSREVFVVNNKMKNNPEI